MHVALHIGVHCTDEDRILNCLAANRDALIEEGIVVPEPARYRPVLRETLRILQNEVATPHMQETIMDAVLDEDDVSRVVLSHESFISVPGRAVEHNMFYPLTSAKTPRLRNLFSECDLSFYVALRDPATFIPAVFERAKEDSFERYTAGSDPMTLRWSDMIARLRTAVPDAPVTVWCNEDTPLIWPEVVRALGGVDPDFPLVGLNDFLRDVMNQNGVQRLETYLKKHPPASVSQRRRVIAAFLDKFANPEAIEQEVDVPGWTVPYVEALSALYDEDVATIAQMPGVTFLAP